ncbi:MAG: hypothetical protein M3Y69_09450 [Verrucomicrobiota bacterium]|nr:hypothetical protein [Verrucomicrobiota bacterium]
MATPVFLKSQYSSHWAWRVAAAVFLALSSVAFAVEPRAVPIDPTIPMFHKWQMQAAVKAVERVAQRGESRVEFCITLVSELDVQFRPLNFGLLRETRDGGAGDTFYPSDAALRAEMKGWCAAAFAKAVEHHLEIAVLLHVNAHGPIQHWRNDWDFDPLIPLAGTSYADALVRPVLDALEEAVPPDWPVQISLQGEMGRTVFAHPQSWLKLINEVKSRGKLRHAIFGLSFNYQWVAGGLKRDESDRATLRKLWDACDFIGLSMYQKMSVSPRSDEIAMNVGQFVGEFAGLGCALPETKPLHFVEFGIGGGGQLPDETFHTPAQDVEAAARTPFVGTNKLEENPWTKPAFVELRRATYAAFCDFLSRPMTRYPVHAAYSWSYGSWDVQGLSTPAFADEKITQRLKEHNRIARP